MILLIDGGSLALFLRENYRASVHVGHVGYGILVREVPSEVVNAD